jgi:hypothetical protein
MNHHIGNPFESMVVYTAITGDYDTLRQQPRHATDSARFVAFVDGEMRVDTKHWHLHSMDQVSDDSMRNAKIHKVLSHKYFPEVEYSLWLDGNVVINLDFPLSQLVSEYLGDCDLAVLQHSRRVRRQTIWDQSVRFLRDTFLPVTSPV